MSTAALPRVTVVVAKHRGAVPLVAAQRAVAIGMICSEEDGKEVRSGPDGACVVGAHAQGRPDAGSGGTTSAPPPAWCPRWSATAPGE